MTKPQGITHFNERARFLVDSKSGRPPYLVDMLEFRRRGFCGCRGWEVRKHCEHISRVRSWLEAEIKSLSGIADITAKELARAVDRILFRWARIEVNAELNPQRYGSSK